jgi:hypothetical protein
MRPFSFLILCAGVFVSQASASIFNFSAILTGAQEVPPTGSPATGSISVILDTTLNTLAVNESWSGLIGGAAAAAHIHCCAPAGTNAAVAVPFNGFPATTSGTYSNTFDLTSLAAYNAPFVTSSGGTAALAESALIAGMLSGQTYANIHDATFPGGEIRGLLAQPTPEPATLALGGLSMMLLGFGRRRRAR